MLELFGLDAKSQARGELGALDSRRQGFETWDLGDRFRSLVTGVSREELEGIAKGIADQKLSDRFSPLARQNAANLGHLTATFSGVDGKTAEELEAEILTDRQRGQALQQALVDSPELDTTAIAANASAGQILQAGSKAERGRADEKERKAENKEQSRYKDTKDLTIMQLLNNQEDRRADRELRRDQQAYENRRLDLQEARLDRKDRQAALQQMMAGLAQMGASIAI